MEFSEALKELQNFGIPVGYEPLGSIFGSHFKAFNLKTIGTFPQISQFNIKKDVEYITSPVVEEGNYIKLLEIFLEILTPKEIKNLEKVFDVSRKEFKPLGEISNEISISFEKIQAIKLESILNNKLKINSYLQKVCNFHALEAVEEVAVEAEEFSLLNFPKIENSSVSSKKHRELLAQESSQTQELSKKVQRVNKIILNTEESNNDSSLQKLTLSLNNILIIKEIVNFCKLEFGLNFRFKDFDIDLDVEIPEIPENLNQMQFETIELVSNCIHLPSDTDNRVVTMFINPLRIYINCFHQIPCKEGNLYREITSTVNSLYVGLRLLNYERPFKSVDVDPADFFTYISY